MLRLPLCGDEDGPLAILSGMQMVPHATLSGGGMAPRGRLCRGGMGMIREAEQQSTAVCSPHNPKKISRRMLKLVFVEATDASKSNRSNRKLANRTR